ncbi:hypothetical protein A2U01_0012315, partial [Trifolium medium]|nr:hypothetical protein [Trifolium medium]
MYSCIANMYCLWIKLLGEEESEGSVPLQVADDMVEDDISSRLLAELLGDEESDGSPLLQVAEDMVEDDISS